MEIKLLNLRGKDALLGTFRLITSILILSILFMNDMRVFAANHANREDAQFSEGKVSQAVVVAGPFDLHRKYRSMEGPYVPFGFKVGDIVASKEVILPESMVNFVEGNNAAPNMMGAIASLNATRSIKGLVHEDCQPRRLLWLKGVKLEVLDENDKVLPTAEFICHWNLDVNPAFRNTVFSEGEKCETVRLVTITQGQREIIFPAGYGVPVASDEPWSAVFQAANRTTDEHKRVKHRCTFYFIKDSDLVYPITALNWYVPWIYVVIDKNSEQAAENEKTNCPSCLGLAMGVNAPNNTANGTFTDSQSRRLSGHWVIPPGDHTYTTMINEEMQPGFSAKPRVIHAVWSHIHPLCTNLSLYQCEGQSRKKLFDIGAKTEINHGIEIKQIDYLSSKKGILMPNKGNYELAVTYKNTTGLPQDSMAAAGIFFEDPTFARPDWVVNAKEGYACSMVKNADNDHGIDQIAADAAQADRALSDTGPSNKSAIVGTPTGVLQTPLFDENKDGPILKQPKSIKLETNAGPIILQIDPSLAPITATQVYRLLGAGLFNGTRICRFEPNFVLQIAAAEDKSLGQLGLSNGAKMLLRRIPLEVSAQKNNELNHRTHVLSMAHYNDVQDSAVSSFSILLSSAPHLDHKYAIFGKIGEDPATLETLSKIEKNWNSNQYYITGVKEL